MLLLLQFWSDFIDIWLKSSLGDPSLGVCFFWRFANFWRIGEATKVENVGLVYKEKYCFTMLLLLQSSSDIIYIWPEASIGALT